MTASRLAMAGLAMCALAALVGNSPAGAAEVVQASGNGNLVRGGAPLPEFRLNFLLDDASRLMHQAPGSDSNLEIALTSPDNGFFRFLFSPRPQFGLGFDRSVGASRGYAGLTWNVFDNDWLFGNIGLASTFDRQPFADPSHRFALQPLTLHGALELGYHIGGPHSLSLSLDESRPPEWRANAEISDNFRVRYGLKF